MIWVKIRVQKWSEYIGVKHPFELSDEFFIYKKLINQNKISESILIDDEMF